jgi:2-polyprenyl-3-methyl-5-hydroxy-6-metoxy-1,4-benzoquinol methylase
MYEERISSKWRNDCYYAHLSIYHFAVQFCENKIVLDAGCGNGYGTLYLAENGVKKIFGIDSDQHAIDEARTTSHPNVSFACGDLRCIDHSDAQYDVIFASNSLEHVDGVEKFLRRSVLLLKKNGILMVAVPAACTEAAVAEERCNPYHLNIWSPRQWFTVLTSYFADVRCYTHILEKQDGRVQLNNRPDQTTISEMDFAFTEVMLNALYEGRTHTAIFVCHNPVEKDSLPAVGSKIKMVDHSVLRPARSRWLHPFIWIFYRTLYILRYEGLKSLLQKVWSKATNRIN